uniref:Heparanase n=1 Tax=Anopheles dirus TaxID=7168 RepID=A0A182NSK5_9DIPT
MASLRTEPQPFIRLWLLVVIVLLVPGVRTINENEVPALGAEPVRQLGVSVNTKRLANVLSDEFVSFLAKPQDIFDGQGNPISETSFLMAQSLGGAYLKVIADSSQLHLQTTAGQSIIGSPDEPELVQIKANAWHAFYDWARRANVIPVFVLDYPTDPNGQWEAKTALHILSAASALGIDDCRWQLGNGQVKDGAKYADDLRTFRTMLKAFPRQQWTLAASELNPQVVSLEEVQYFHANVDNLVDAVTITRPPSGNAAWNYTSVQRDVHLRGLSKQRVPVWLDLVADRRADVPDDSPLESTVACCGACLRDGLEYARTLGEAARGGISAVFKPLQRNNIHRYSLNYLIALLYKQTVGHKVFPAVHQGHDPAVEATSRTSVYAYCTRNRTGSLTLVVVNGDELGATNATIKLMTRASSSPVELFLVTVQDGQPMVNNRPLEPNALPQLEPVTAVTTLSHGISFYVPAQTILFAVVPGVQVRECRTDAVPSPRKKLPRELLHDRTSTDLLLEDLISELVEKAPPRTLQRKRRSLAAPAFAGAEKRKRFHARLAHAPQDGGLAESLSGVLEEAQLAPEQPTERTARGPRQTQAYKRQQRRIRKKEKRGEKRNLRKMKHPLREAKRERSKRGDMLMQRRAAATHHPHRRLQHERLLKRMSAKLASRKTKRSSLAEAVNEPPAFSGSDEEAELMRRSDFPMGDVHLVISKGPAEGEVDYVPADDELDVQPREEMAVEEDEEELYRKPAERRASRHRPAVRRRVTINQRDFHRFAPAWERKLMDGSEDEGSDCQGRRRTLRRRGQELEARETKRFDRFMTIRREQSEEVKPLEMQLDQSDTTGREEFTIAQGNDLDLEAQQDIQRYVQHVPEEAQPTDDELAEADASGQHSDEATDRTPAASEEEVHLFTPAPQTSEERQIIPQLDPTWSLEVSSSAEVAELQPHHHHRYKRSLPHPATVQSAGSIESQDVERLEDFFRTNAKLQKKFAEMFDLLLEAIEELESEENDAREVVADDEDDGATENDATFLQTGTHRTKRNVLLHPQSWESRERSNMIHRQQASDELSIENRIIPQLLHTVSQPVASAKTAQQEHHPEQPEEHEDDDGKPGAFMLRSVVNFMRRASSEFHQLFSGWFGKSA